MPSMDGPGNRKMFEKFVGDKTGEWKVSANTVVNVQDMERIVRLHGNPIAVWFRNTLTLSACGWATPTTIRKLNYLCQQLHICTMIPFYLVWGIAGGNVMLSRWNKETGESDSVKLPTNDWSVHIEYIEELTPERMNYNARLDSWTEELFNPTPKPEPLPIFKPLSFHQMKGVL